ncbi:GNAT family N-acetyltransferase [Brachybacterium sp. J153]|uniref:GNAT family N-acetyltransferase n=1 Tax=Brachybacterium sp. J153 TaxID=3116488 RepID=UPI002E77DEAC|nr:GNAT family N-acetyltransferase [Brachybacterium sp. J153]MEE1619160.1 GNAT family N-acetyltransferase [Brachybacterium sp. J153]
MDGTSPAPGAVRLLHDDDRDRYQALDGEEVVAVLYYEDEHPPATAPAEGSAPDPAPRTLRDLRSTVVTPARSGRGLGSALVRFALDDIRAQDLRVRATCWFVHGWIERHPEYADLLETP